MFPNEVWLNKNPSLQFAQSEWQGKPDDLERLFKLLEMHEALKERASQGRRAPVPALLAVVATSLVGVIDECIQAILPSRVFDVRDILFNALAAIMAVAACAALAWARRWTSRRRRS